LVILGVPVPSDMDGNVMREIFDRELHLGKEPVESQRGVYQHLYTEEEEEKIKDRLSALGYFD